MAAGDRMVEKAGKEINMRTKICQLVTGKAVSLLGQEHTIKGWVKTVRNQKNLTFIEVNDGSSFANLQVVVESGTKGLDAALPSISTGRPRGISGPCRCWP